MLYAYALYLSLLIGVKEIPSSADRNMSESFTHFTKKPGKGKNADSFTQLRAAAWAVTAAPLVAATAAST